MVDMDVQVVRELRWIAHANRMWLIDWKLLFEQFQKTAAIRCIDFDV